MLWKIFDSTRDIKALVVSISFLFIALIIVLALFIKSANGFQQNIKKDYFINTFEINKKLENQYKENVLLRKELEKNIMLDESATNSTIATRIDLLNKDTFNKYKCKLFAYLPHINDDKNLRGIPIPQELKSIIEQSFLAGDQSIEFKNELISIYHKYNINEEIMTPKSLKNETIKVYLKNDLREKIEEEESAEIVKLINTHVILNDIFKKGNPLPSDIIQDLRKLREDTSIKDRVNNYYYGISIITYILLIIIAYACFHALYVFCDRSPIVIQIVSIIAIALLAIIGFIGWWVKELWL